jgi:molybdopterin/thiamine biosynthesis adenylyltransferase
MDFTARFHRMLSPDQAARTVVLLLGCGGIGSYTAAILARMGIGVFVLIDNDNVEAANVGTQDFTPLDVGDPKVDATRDRVQALNPNAKIFTINARIEDAKSLVKVFDQFKPHIAIAAVDNIEARRLMWEVAQKYDHTTYIDPRMGAESYEMHVLTPGCAYQSEYESFLKDTTYAEEPCGATAIAYTGAFAGAMIASTVRQVVNDEARTGCVYGDTGAFEVRNTLPKRERAVA